MSNLSAASAQKAMFAVGGPVDLRKYTKLKPAVAEQLRCDAEIDLSGLTEFTPELAAAFKYHHEGLILDGLKTLTPETAESFKNHFRGKLTMNGLEEIDDQSALFLSQREAGSEPYKYWPKTILERVRKLSDTEGHLALFEKLASCSTYETIRFKEITPRQAKILGRKADKIDLWRIEQITPEVAKALSEFPKTISMNFLKKITVEEASAFADHMGHLSLTGLEKIDDEVAMALSKHKGSLSLSGLDEMPDTPGFIALAETLVTNKDSHAGSISKVGQKIAEIFSANPKFGYNLKKFEDTEGHKQLLRAICAAEDKSAVEFWGVDSIPDSVLQILVDCPKKIAVNSLSEWTEEPAHIRLAERMVENQRSGGVTDSLYVNGDSFPDKIAGIFATASQITFRNLKELDDSPGNLALAQKLSDTGAYLGVRKISAPAARILRSKSTTNLMTGELSELDAETFSVLFPSGAGVYLSNLKELRDDVAAQMSDIRSVSLDGLTAISLASAQSLSKGEGSLSLKGLVEISDDVLGALAQRAGELNLSGLAELSPSQASILKQHKGNLVLDGLKDVSQEVLDILADADPEKLLSLESVAEVSDSVASKLAKRTGSVRLSSIRELSDSDGHVALAKKLAGSSWHMEFKNISSLAPKAAEQIVTVSTISLGGLEKVDADLAKVFSAYTGTLKLRSLKEISLEAAQELGKAPCDQVGLELGFVDDIPDDVFSALVANKRKLSFKANSITVEKTRAIVKIPSLYIEVLKTMDVDCAKCFKGYKGDVYLSSLEHLDADAAAELRKLRRKLSTNRSGEAALATGL